MRLTTSLATAVNTVAAICIASAIAFPHSAGAATTADQAYNTGVTALARNDTAVAIADLIVAKDRAPRDQEITAALSSARLQSGGDIHAPEPWPISATELGTALVLANLAFAASLVALRRRAPQVALAVLTICLAALWIARLQSPSYAVVSKSGIATHAANDATSLERFPTHLGDELPIDTARGEWLLVRGSDGTRAYIERSAVVVAAD